LVFPKLEQHFDLSAVIEYLVTKPELNVIQNSLLHGYANPYSGNYDFLASTELEELLSDVECYLNGNTLNGVIQKLHGAHQVLSVEKWR
jgi:hypothetical protein